MQNITLEYAEPFRFQDLVKFFRDRACIGVESIDDASYSRTVRFHPTASDAKVAPSEYVSGWIEVKEGSKPSTLTLSVSDSLISELPYIEDRVRQQFDLDCDPISVHESLSIMTETIEDIVILGTRVPGCFDPFETCTRAVIGQQVSVKAANKMAARMIDALGEDIHTGRSDLMKLFPTPEAIAQIDGIEDVLGPLGIIRRRAQVIQQIARMILDGSLDLSAEADPEELITKLCSLNGIGPWTANYIAMRTIKHADAFLETDVGVKHALPGFSSKEILAMAERWRPYRAYANVCLWNSLG